MIKVHLNGIAKLLTYEIDGEYGMICNILDIKCEYLG